MPQLHNETKNIQKHISLNIPEQVPIRFAGEDHLLTGSVKKTHT